MQPFSSPLDWAEWVPECLQPAIAIASEMPFHHHLHDLQEQEFDEELQNSHLDQALLLDQTQEEQVFDLFAQNYRAHHRPLHHPAYHLPQQQQQEHQQELHHQQQQLPISPSIFCVSCKESHTSRRAGTCLECYEEASETEEVLKKEIEDLTARIAFLKTWAPEAMAENCTDLVLECSDGSKIRAHRAVLVSRSSVFRAMLESEMEESRSGTIKITDFTYEVLRLFVHYLYTAEIHPESLNECAFDLLALAEKYNVKHLKSVCERFMTSKVNNENALFSFEYASEHGAKILKEASLSTILEIIHELPKKDEYRDLVNRDAKLVVEIFEVYLAKQADLSS